MKTATSSRGTISDIPLAEIDIGKAQVRTDLASGIDDLAASIKAQGLIQPIVVAKKSDGRYELLAGQRRLLAHQRLGYTAIRATILEESDSAEYSKVGISLTENIVRRDNTQKELIDACTKLYKHYGSIKMVAQETGLNPTIVGKYVKYDQLVPALKVMVDDARLEMHTALQAQKAASNPDGTVDEEAASKFAIELSPMSNHQRKTFVKAVEADPTASLEEKIEAGKKQPVLRQVVVTLEDSTHHSLQSFAKDEGLNQDEAAASLIEDGLTRRGLIE